MKKPEFKFELTKECAEWNFLVFRKYGFNLEKALRMQQGTPLEYGSEFRTVSELEPIFKHHPLWIHMKENLTTGAIFPLAELDEETRLADLQAALNRGNHKGATKKPDLLSKLVEKDVIHGYGLPLPLPKISRIPGIVLAPLNIQAQNTINEFGQIIEKDRLTHDQSFDFSPDSSVNSRVIWDDLPPVRYGQCMKRIINRAVATRRKYPNKKILTSKIDYKSAYRRVHLAWQTALQTCTQITEQEIAVLSLRLTFGGSPCPTKWNSMSEPATDLANIILRHPDWNPNELYSPLSLMLPERIDLPDDIPFGEGRELAVDVPVDGHGSSEVYIDDTFTQTVDLPGNVLKAERAVLLAIHAIARPIADEEPIPRETMAAMEKFLAEAGMEETKIMLGWLLDFRRLEISLPDNKATAWSQEIADMLKEGKTKAKRLERNIGRFVNIGMILPYVHHFLARMRTLLKKAKKRQSAVTIPEEVQLDLKLMDSVIKRANKGVDMNNLAHRMPDHVFKNDSCPFGLGGFDVQGNGWRWIIPPDLRFRASNNLLEHLANIASKKWGLHTGVIKKGDCVLTMSDSMVSTSWLRKSNFDEEPDDEADKELAKINAAVRNKMCREDALTAMENEICDYSQWFPGKENVVADSLSRDDDRTDDELTFILKTFCPEQVPSHFRIVPLPKEITSWLTSVLRKLPVREQLREEHTRTKLGRGTDGVSTQKCVDSKTTSTLTTANDTSESECSEVSPKPCEKHDFPVHHIKPWLKQQSEMPSHMWLRPLGTTIGGTLPSTKTESLHDFYQDNIEPTETQTHP